MKTRRFALALVAAGVAFTLLFLFEEHVWTYVAAWIAIATFVGTILSWIIKVLPAPGLRAGRIVRNLILALAVTMITFLLFEAARDLRSDEEWTVWFHGGSALIVIVLMSLWGASAWQSFQKEKAWKKIEMLLDEAAATLPWTCLSKQQSMERGAKQRRFYWEEMDQEFARMSRANAERAIRRTLRAIADNLDVGIPKLFYLWERQKIGPRHVSLWVPDDNRQKFCCLGGTPDDGQYNKLARKYRPSMHNATGYATLRKTWPAPEAAKGQWREYTEARAKVTSFLGSVWVDCEVGDKKASRGTFVLIQDVNEVRYTDKYFDFGHENYLSRPVRTIYVRPLQVRDERIGLLVVVDPVVRGLYMRDEDLLEAGAHLLEISLNRHLYFSDVLGLKPWQP